MISRSTCTKRLDTPNPPRIPQRLPQAGVLARIARAFPSKNQQMAARRRNARRNPAPV
jgi:hypothetical protein